MQFKFLAAFGFAICVSAAPAAQCPPNTKTTTSTCDAQICVDYIDACGQEYGGCFLAPECGGTTPTFTTPSCNPTITPTPTITATPTSTCDTSICADYVNDCGINYGGCFLASECGGTWPSFTPPPCPSTTTTCTYSICADYTNSCGMPCGGCFLAPQCGGTWPTFTTPDCPTPTGYSNSSSKPAFCEVTSTICTDRYNPCSPRDIGTCYLNPLCGGATLEPPNTVCSSTTTVEVTTTLGRYEKVKRIVEWYTWTTTIPEVTPTVIWAAGL